MNVISGAMGGIAAVTSGMSALASNFTAIGTEASNAFGALDGMLVGATALIAGFSVEAAKAYGEFEQGMKIVQAVSGQTGAAISELSSKASQMSVAYRTSINDITDGLQTLGRAGLNSVSEQIDVLENGLQTAKLEGRSLNGVLEELIQNTAMLGGDLKSVNFGEQSEYINSLLVGTSMTAPINSHDISQTLQYAGGTAAAAGANIASDEGKKKLEDLMGTVAAFAQKGVTGSVAGTALRAFFTKPASQDPSVTNALGELGLAPEDLWEDGGESMKSVSDQIGLIHRRMEALNMSTMDQVELWGKIVGAKMGQQMMKLDSSSIKELTRDIQSAKSAEDLATQTLQTYNQKLSEMEQQGQVAYREFGEKAAFWLRYPIEGATKLLEFLSNPVVNTIAFSGVGALLAHGFRTAYGMAQTLYRQIRELINGVVAGIEQINGAAGASSTGFSQSATQVDFLNAKLHETDATLQSIQAKSMGIRPGYQLPGGLYTDKVPKRTFKAYEEDVIIDKNGLMGKGDGIFSGEHIELFEESVDKYASQLEEDMRIELGKNNKKGMKIWKRTGIPIDVQKEALNDLKVQDADIMHGVKSPEFKKAIAPYVAKSEYKDISLDELSESLEDTTLFKDRIKELREEGISKLRTEFKLFDEFELKEWKKRQKDRGYLGDYSLRRAGEFYNEDGTVNEESVIGKQHGEELKELRKRKYYVVPESHAIPESSPNSQVLGQALNDNTINEMANVRDQIIDKQKRELMGETGIRRLNNQAYEIGSQRLGVFSRSIEKASSATSNFFTKIKNASQEKSIQWGARKRGKDFWSDAGNIGDYQSKAFSKLTSKGFQELNKGADVKTVASNLRKELNLTATEFSALVNSEQQYREVFNLTGESLEGVANEATRLREAIAATTISEEEEAAANAESIAAEKAEAAASIQSAAAEEAESASSMMSGLSGLAGSAASGLTSVVGYLGGPLMAGMIAVTVGMQLVQASQQAWQEEMQRATEELSEATDSLSQTEEDIKQLYSDENNNITNADLDKAVDRQYASVYDSFYNGVENRASLGTEEFESDVSMVGKTNEETGEYSSLTADEIASRNEGINTITLVKDENVKALNENTMQLAEATAAYNQAQERQAEKFTDPSWGFDSITANATDFLGEMQEQAWNIISDGEKAGFLDNNAPILTGSQGDSNYVGSTELAGIFAADAYRFDDEKYTDLDKRFSRSLDQFFGSDYDRIISLMSSMDGKMSNGGLDALYTNTQNMGELSAQEMGIAQMSLKNNKEDYQKLAKQSFRREQSTGRSSYQDARNLLKASSGDRQALKALGGKSRLSVQDKNMATTMKKLLGTTNKQLDAQNVVALAQLQQLQDMHTVANETIGPGIMQNVQAAYDNVSMTGSATDEAGGAKEGAVTAANNAKIIANFLGAQAQDVAEKSAYKEYKRRKGTMSEEQFMARLADLDDKDMDYYRIQEFKSLRGAGWAVQNPADATPENIEKNANRLIVDSNYLDNARKNGASYQDLLNTVSKPLVEFAQSATTSAYDQSNIGEYGSGSRSLGSGSRSSGSDSESGKGSSSDSGKTQNVKNRVDLVLCNKKTIPKLNVNLFKKPPSFTILNKNFKVRDIKINTQDKPKAMLNALKNGIIDTQRRMDPKIIQDEEAEYMPTEATDGDNLPKGSTQTTT